MVVFERMQLQDVPWRTLDEFEDRVVFQTREWLLFVAESQGAEPVVAQIRDGRTTLGYFSGLIKRRMGCRILGSSFPGWTTPYIGFNLNPGASRSSVLPAFVKWVFGDLKCIHFEVSDRCFSIADGDGLGLTASTYQTYRSDLTRSEEQLFGDMESACRRCIRKAEKSGVIIEQASDPGFADEYYAQLKDVFAKQGELPTYSLARVQILLKHLLPTGNLLLLRAFSPDRKCIATGIYPGFNDVAQFWGNASWRSHQHFRPNEALHWHAMRYWKERGVKLFDWGGGGQYKEKYGVQPYSVPWFYKSKYRAVTVARNEARTLFYKAHTLLSRLRGVPSGSSLVPSKTT
jgi:hypothetical protein